MRSAFATCLAVGAVCAAFGQTYTIQPFAGGGWPEKVPALSVGLANSVLGMAVDQTGSLYFSIVNFVFRIDSAGNLVRIAGNGLCGYAGDNGPAAAAELCEPAGLALDSGGTLYIADSGNNVVRKVANGIITTFAGNGVQGYAGDHGSATSAQLAGPWGLALDAAGNLYIADSGNSVVRKVANGIITTAAGGGSYTSDGPATSAGFYSVQYIAVDAAGSLYIADHYSVIRKVSNGVITTVAGSYYDYGLSDGENIPATSAAFSPSGLAADSSGNLYVSDGVRSRVRKISNGVINTIAGTGVEEHAGDGGPATSAQLNPATLAMGANGDLYVADLVSHMPGTWIRKISSGTITTIAGNGVNETGDGYIDIFGADDNGPATDGFFDTISGVAVDPAGNVYVGDAAFSVLREISNGKIRTVAGNWSDEGPFADNVPATQVSLSVWDVAADAGGNAYVADWDHSRVRRISNGIITTVAGGGTAPGDNTAATSVKLDSPEGVAVDSSGNNIYVTTDGCKVRKVSGGIISTVAGNGTTGYGGDGGAAVDAQLNSPVGVTVDANGIVYVADAGNSRIRQISGGIITTIAGNGTAGYDGDNGPAVNAQLNRPTGVAVDTHGNVYVADTENSRIRKISNGVITTIAGSGIEGRTGDGGLALSAQLNHPGALAVDAAGNIYFTDTGNRRVRVLVPAESFPCVYSVDSQTLATAASGGTVTITVTAAAGCGWTASSGASWMAATSETSGSGNGTVTYTAAANTSSSLRTATLTIAGQAVYLNQAAAGEPVTSLVNVPSGGIINAATGATTVAPGSFISLYGQNLSDVTGDWGSAITDGLTLPTSLHGVRVRINGKDCYIYFVSSGQINVLTPPDTATGPVLVEVFTNHGSAAAMVQLSDVSPGWFTYGAQGKTYVAALTYPDYLLAAPVNVIPGTGSRPVAAGESVQLYANGLGATNAPYPAGQVFARAYEVADRSVIQVTIDGQPAPVTYAGMVAPGLFQVNILVPDGVASGDQPVVLTVNGHPGQTNAVIAFQ